MKKTLSIFLLLITTAFACDLPHENIQNVKIGCPFEMKEDYVQQQGDDIPKTEAVYTTNKNIEFFDEAEIYVREGIISDVIFIKKYQIDNKNKETQVIFVEDVRRIAKQMVEKWGNDFDKNNASYLLSDVKKIGNNDSENELIIFNLLEEDLDNDKPKSEILGMTSIWMTEHSASDDANPLYVNLYMAYHDKQSAREIKK